MVVHQNITNLAGYFHFLNVRKIPYVIISAIASHANWAADGKVLKIFFGTSRNMESWLAVCCDKIHNRGIAPVLVCLSSGPVCGWEYLCLQDC